MLKRYLITTKTLLLSFLRDRQSLFFTLALPLVFLFIFGFVFQGFSEDGGRLTNAAVYVTSGADDRENFWPLLGAGDLRVTEVDSQDAVQESVSSFNADLGLVWDGSTLRAYTNPTRMQDNQYFLQVARGIRSELNQRKTGLVTLIQVEQKYVGDDSLMELDYLFPGIIALGILSSGLFAIAGSFMRYKDMKVLKRFMATSMHKANFLAALMTTRMVASLMSTFLVLAAGITVFGLQLTVNWMLFLPYVLVGTVIMMGFGALVTLIAKTAENAVQISSILMTIMMFFSGIYFPVEFLPSYFQRISSLLPLSYIARGIRYTMGIESMSVSSFLGQNLLLLLAAIALIWVVTLSSRWSEG